MNVNGCDEPSLASAQEEILGAVLFSRRAVLVAAGVSAAAATLAVAGGARYPARRTPACQLRAPGPQPPNLNWFSMVPRTSSSELYHLLTKTYGQTPAQNWSYPRHSPAPH
jgi:hypothetical protein